MDSIAAAVRKYWLVQNVVLGKINQWPFRIAKHQCQLPYLQQWCSQNINIPIVFYIMFAIERECWPTELKAINSQGGNKSVGINRFCHIFQLLFDV